MIYSYFKYALRSIKSRKFESITNVLGLSISFSICLIISIHLVNELSYDEFHDDSENTYRIVWESDMIGSRLATIPEIPITELVERYPEITNGLQLYRKSNFGFKLDDVGIIEDNIFYTTNNFFDFFKVELSQGGLTEALSEPNSIVLTNELAFKYFGKRNAVGEFIEDIDGNIYKVTAVIEHFPKNSSHIEFKALVSLITLEKARNPWARQAYIYLKLDSSAKAVDVEKKIQEITVPEFASWFNIIRDAKLYLQPITEIHLNSNLGDEIKENGNANYLAVLGIIGLTLIVVASINYINLSTSRYKTRVPEIGIRKTFGADQKSIFWQFIVESLLISFLAYTGSILFARLLSPFFNNSFNTAISLTDSLSVVLGFFFFGFNCVFISCTVSQFLLIKAITKEGFY